MNIFVYSDESGVLDKNHFDYYVYGGVIYLSKDDKETAARMYLKVERDIRKSESVSGEVKGAKVSPKAKSKIYRSLNNTHKFGVVIHEQEILPEIFSNKKSKQRYLDYAYKIGIKRKFEKLIRDGYIIPDEVDHIFFFVDEHTTATDGRYELQENLETEFKRGTFNHNYQHFYKPIFPKVMSVEVKYCNSETTTLVRAADIVANKLYYLALHGNVDDVCNEHMSVTYLPHERKR